MEPATTSGASVWGALTAVWNWFRTLAGIARKLANVHATLDAHATSLAALQAEVDDLKRRRGLTPTDVVLVDGIPWGMVAAERHPFCPVCSDKPWTPLPRFAVNRGASNVQCGRCKGLIRITASLDEWLKAGADPYGARPDVIPFMVSTRPRRDDMP